MEIGTLDSYRLDGGGFEDSDGLYHEDATDLIQCGLLGLCGCGGPEDNLSYILAGLALIDEQIPDLKGALDEWWEGHKARIADHFKSPEGEYFFYYWADKEGLTDHGGSVPGWLTDKGRALLSLLREWESE